MEATDADLKRIAENAVTDGRDDEARIIEAAANELRRLRKKVSALAGANS